MAKKRYPVFCRRRKGPWHISEIKDCNRRAGQHFFDDDTLRFFASRISSTVHQGKDGVFFVTSEQFRSWSHTGKRLYTVRSFNPKTGKVDTVGEHQQYNTMGRAQTAAKEAAGPKRVWRGNRWVPVKKKRK